MMWYDDPGIGAKFSHFERNEIYFKVVNAEKFRSFVLHYNLLMLGNDLSTIPVYYPVNKIISCDFNRFTLYYKTVLRQIKINRLMGLM